MFILSVLVVPKLFDLPRKVTPINSENLYLSHYSIICFISLRYIVTYNIHRPLSQYIKPTFSAFIGFGFFTSDNELLILDKHAGILIFRNLVMILRSSTYLEKTMLLPSRTTLPSTPTIYHSIYFREY